MRPGFGQFNVATTEYLQFAAQFGATDVLLNTPVLPGAQRWELVDLVKLRGRRWRTCRPISMTTSC